MITLTTGTPGAGKTLYSLYSIKSLAEKENRPVYYHGIPDLTLDWNELENPERWHECPEGSIIVLDECQKTFRTRGTGAQVPEHVAKLETHRHKGHDLFLITQHPMLIDSNVRRLVGRHFHVHRTFGMQRATVHEFTQVQINPDQKRTGSIRHEWSYPKEVFGYYKSAELHTVKRQIPVRVWLFLALPLVIAALLYIGWLSVAHRLEKPQESAPSGLVDASAAQPPAQLARAAPLQAMDFAEANTPRINFLPSTAPKYDQLTAPQSAPVVMGCVASKDRCMCYTRQATRLNLPDDLCRQYATQGVFDDTRPADSSFEEKQNPPQTT